MGLCDVCLLDAWHPAAPVLSLFAHAGAEPESRDWVIRLGPVWNLTGKGSGRGNDILSTLAMPQVSFVNSFHVCEE
jgi:hypothetical protein